MRKGKAFRIVNRLRLGGSSRHTSIVMRKEPLRITDYSLRISPRYFYQVFAFLLTYQAHVLYLH